MKFFIILLLIILNTNAFGAGETPRETMRIFLKSMVAIKKGEGHIKTHYDKAISTLEINQDDPLLRYDIGKTYAISLINTLDKIKKVNYEEIPETWGEKKWYFDQRSYNNENLEISLINRENKWFFSKETLTNLSLYTELLKTSSVVAGVTQLTTLSDYIKANYPIIFSEKSLLIYNWQWIGIVFILMIAFIFKTIFEKVLTLLLNKYFKIVSDNSNAKLIYAMKPLDKILFWTVILQLFPYLEFHATGVGITKRLLYILLSIYSVWLGHRVIELLTYYGTQKAKETEAKFDDILVPLISKTAYIIIYILGAILIANSLTINVSGIIAGLGIGGLAFAFAAKDTLANFFGSIMLVLDRPFDIGDIIKAGDVEGTVTEVGFRSTRIRTFNDSLITISNGELMNRAIENSGKRRFRRLVTTLGVEYDTPAEKIEAFCEGIRQIIINHKWTRKDAFHVYFESFGDFSLNIKMTCYWETDDYARELAEKHRLLVDILRLASDIGVEFAFPTQTIHMFNESKIEKTNLEGEFREIGRQKAKEVIKKPVTLKNPRSNATDEEQFGKNEVES